MNWLLVLICIILVGLQFTLPRPWAFIPLLVAACHTPYTADIGGFTVARFVILAGLMRAAGTGLIQFDWYLSLDRWMLAFSIVALLSALGHTSIFSNPYIFRIGLILNVMGTYLYARAYLVGINTLENLAKGLIATILPFAIFMLLEKMSGINPYTALGAQNEISLVRDGKIRAQGPFGTPILAGTVGACSFPLLIPLWRSRRALVITGFVACLVITYSSASSGPISTAFLGLVAIALWRLRAHMRLIQISTICTLIVLHFIKERPIWYLMALMDFVGGSTGWHRAYLIDAGVRHINEWWLWGTDHTGHWMPYSLPTPVPGLFQADLTNYYLHLGVIGGLPLLFCLISVQWSAFSQLGGKIREIRISGSKNEFALWCLGSALFAHSITFLSISYFDQMYVFFWIIVGCLPAILKAQESTFTSDDQNCLSDNSLVASSSQQSN